MVVRLTPYELILEPLERELFPAIRAEAEQRGGDPPDRDAFLLLGFAGAALDAMVSDDAPPEAMDEYGELLYLGYAFWSVGRRLYVFDEEVTARLTAPRYEFDDWQPAAPPACYLRFPYQSIWARIAASAPFEPVDGCFTAFVERPGRPASLDVQLVLGLRPDRPGVSLVTHRTQVQRDTVRRAAEPLRDDGSAFANVIPGGERQGLRTIVSTGELEALVLRAFHYLDRNPSKLQQLQAPAPSPSADQLTHLPHVLVTSTRTP